MLFHGSLNTDLPPAYKGVTKSGYCAIRSKPRKVFIVGGMSVCLSTVYNISATVVLGPV